MSNKNRKRTEQRKMRRQEEREKIENIEEEIQVKSKAEINEDKFFELSRRITKDFYSLLGGDDPLFLKGLDRIGLEKIPNSQKARRAFDRYIKMIEVFHAHQIVEEEPALKSFMNSLNDSKSDIREELIKGWIIVDPNNGVYKDNEDLTIKTAQRIIQARIDKINERNNVTLGNNVPEDPDDEER